MSDSTEFAVEAVQAATRRQHLDGGERIAEDELRQLIEIAGELHAITGFDGRFQLLNPAWERTLGYTRDELRARPFLDFVHPDDRSKTSTTAEKLQPGLDLLSFTNRYLSKDGSVRVLEWRAVVSAEAQRYYTVTRDLTPVLAARERSAALDALCELLPAGVVMQDAEGLVTRWDGAAVALFGHPASAIVGTPLSRWLSDESSGEGIDLLRLVADGRDEGAGACLLNAAGAKVPVVLSIREFGDGLSPVTGAVARVERAPVGG